MSKCDDSICNNIKQELIKQKAFGYDNSNYGTCDCKTQCFLPWDDNEGIIEPCSSIYTQEELKSRVNLDTLSPIWISDYFPDYKDTWKLIKKGFVLPSLKAIVDTYALSQYMKYAEYPLKSVNYMSRFSPTKNSDIWIDTNIYSQINNGEVRGDGNGYFYNGTNKIIKKEFISHINRVTKWGPSETMFTLPDDNAIITIAFLKTTSGSDGENDLWQFVVSTSNNNLFYCESKFKDIIYNPHPKYVYDSKVKHVGNFTTIDDIIPGSNFIAVIVDNKTGIRFFDELCNPIPVPDFMTIPDDAYNLVTETETKTFVSTRAVLGAIPEASSTWKSTPPPISPLQREDCAAASACSKYPNSSYCKSIISKCPNPSNYNYASSTSTFYSLHNRTKVVVYSDYLNYNDNFYWAFGYKRDVYVFNSYNMMNQNDVRIYDNGNIEIPSLSWNTNTILDNLDDSKYTTKPANSTQEWFVTPNNFFLLKHDIKYNKFMLLVNPANSPVFPEYCLNQEGKFDPSNNLCKTAYNKYCSVINTGKTLNDFLDNGCTCVQNTAIAEQIFPNSKVLQSKILQEAPCIYDACTKFKVDNPDSYSSNLYKCPDITSICNIIVKNQGTLNKGDFSQSCGGGINLDCSKSPTICGTDSKCIDNVCMKICNSNNDCVSGLICSDDNICVKAGPSKKKTNFSLIIGVSIGSLLLLILIVFLIVYFVRRRRN